MRRALRQTVIAAVSAAAAFPINAAPAAPAELDRLPRLQEIVFSVSNLEGTLPVYTDVLLWQLLHRGPAPAVLRELWHLPSTARIEEALLGNAAAGFGFLRLVQVNGVRQVPIRPGGRYWDTGGIFNINFQVRDLAATVMGLRALGWYNIGFPETYGDNFKESVSGISTVMLGPDHVVFSFQERYSPPLENYPPFAGASHVVSSYQMIQDLGNWRRFFVNVLGFEFRGDWERTNPEPIGPNDYGLPHNAIGFTDQIQTGAYPNPDRQQVVGAMQFPNAEGYDFSMQAIPPNLGILAWRFVVPDVDALARRVTAAGVALEQQPRRIKLPPYGPVKMFAVRTPDDGRAWLEFFATP